MSRNIWLTHLFLPLKNNEYSRTAILARKLASLGHNVTVFHSSFDHFTKKFHEDTIPQENDPSGGTVQFVQLNGVSYQKNISIKRFWNHYTCARYLKQNLHTFPVPDAIIASYPDPYICDVLSKYAEQNSVPFALDIRDQWPDIFLDYVSGVKAIPVKCFTALEKMRLKTILSRTQNIFTMSQDFKEWVLSINSNLEVDVVYLAPRNLVQSSTVQRPFGHETPVVYCFVGSFNMAQNPVRIIKAFSRFQKTHPGHLNARLLIAGGGEQTPQVQQLAAEMENVSYLGWLSPNEIDNTLENVHVGLLTLEFKALTFNNKSFTYLANSVPIISAAYGELRIYFSENECGWNIEPGSTEALENAFQTSYNDIRSGINYNSNVENMFNKHFSQSENYNRYAKKILKMIETK